MRLKLILKMTVALLSDEKIAELIVSLLKSISKQTPNTLDDKIVEQIEKLMLNKARKQF
ncbi:MAG: hypothetical protein RBS16_09440 [Candidatus Cloacimonadales bacterium]|jgi:hypothetical protein|nr:hypothetical protein [Candidatus Cloacimonadota bacterium]MDD3502416.1 hypothetical protein [Candidatus Cloacimonadota bacterium]MDX9978235.1 hypothetical protein [Candidatus Cloacimonadales bacterium]